MNSDFPIDIAVVGGAGHVGLPLAMTFADCGLRTLIFDTNHTTIETIRAGTMPFAEVGGQEMLTRVLSGGLLELESVPDRLRECEVIVMVIGTPVDEHLNPNFNGIRRVVEQCRSGFRDGQMFILRSTVFPGLSAYIQQYFRNEGLEVGVAFCPERVAQGRSLEEFRTLPQIISAFDPATLGRVRALFGRFAAELVEMEPMEAELCKLMTNAWRYVQFATVNQFYMIASRNGLDFDRILHACRHHYPRMSGMPGPGLTAGPCLVKDTMQLAAFSQNNFVLGHAAMLINEGLPAHLIELAAQRIDLSTATAGILGMAFKAESDDPRDSLSYKLKKLLELRARRVLCCDPYVPDPTLTEVETVIAAADVLFIATPHAAYRKLVLPPGKIVIDVWNVSSQQGVSA
ncbi:MAG TPA: nucleotide sugar dehydrogenase [Thermoanaerobaculia bacterium]|nr:nucleotide sugar dehydrogenase [Thermoanaerobaculia bacterium]